MRFVKTDGGRAAAGYKGRCGDCCARAVAIATGKPYGEVYAAINEAAKAEKPRKGRKRSSARTGVWPDTAKRLLASWGWTWIPTMGIGTGCRVHLDASELPPGRLIVRLARHYAAVVDGVLHDTWNSAESRVEIYPVGCIADIPAGAIRQSDGSYRHAPKRCVYGYWIRKTA